MQSTLTVVTLWQEAKKQNVTDGSNKGKGRTAYYARLQNGNASEKDRMRREERGVNHGCLQDGN